jgi:sn-glycerol 3-phosphate transport system substrate-binding protein
MRFSRWMWILTFGTILALITVACVAPTTAPPAAEEAEQAPAEQPEQAPAEEGVTNVVFWHAMGGDRVELIAGMVDDFNASHPNINVSVEYKGSYRDTLNATLAAARGGGVPPHVVQVFEIGTLPNIDSGVFVPVEDLINEGEVEWDDFLNPVLDYYRVDGKLYSMPWNSSNAILYVNQDILEEAGLDPESPPQTFEEVVEMGHQIVDSGAAESATTWPLHTWFFEQWMADMGQVLVNNENGRAGAPTEINLESEAARRIFEWWDQLYKEGLWINPGIENWAQARQNFISGQVAMLISSTSDVTQMENAAAEQDFNVTTAFIPIPADVERHGVVIGGASLWITKDHPTEELQAAKDFVLWMSEPEQQVRWHKGTGYFPIRQSAIDMLEEEGWFEEHPSYKAAFDQLLATQPSPATQGALLGVFPEARTLIEEAVEKVITDQASIDDALAEADTKTEEAMADYNELTQ